jgi:hypothetical protein
MAIFTTGQAGGQAIQPTSVPAAYTTDAQDLARSQRLAQMLTASPMPEGQMISGRYVAPSITQNLAQLANMATGAYFSDKAEKQNQALAQKLRTGETEALADFMKTKQGTPAEMFAAQAGPMPTGGNIPLQESKAAVAPNQQAAFANLYQDPRSPQRLRDLAFTKMMADPEAFTLNEGATRFITMPDGSTKEVATGGTKAAPEIRQAMQQLGINKNLDQLTPQELQAVNAKIDELNKSKRSSVSLTIPTEGERKAGFMSNILDRNILQMQTALGIDPTAVKPNVPSSIVAALTGPSLLSRSMTPAQRQIVEDSQLDVLDAALTLRTGAAYTPVQLNAMRDTYFPVLGDKKQAIDAKKQRLETLLEGAYIAAGRAMPQRVSSPPPPAPPPNNSIAGNAQQTNLPKISGPRFLGFETPQTGQ